MFFTFIGYNTFYIIECIVSRCYYRTEYLHSIFSVLRKISDNLEKVEHANIKFNDAKFSRGLNA